MPVDSEEGIKILMNFARAGTFVLSPYHRELAIKRGVDYSGVVFSDPLPAYHAA